MRSAYGTFSTKVTPQHEPIPGKDMVENSAGGYVFGIDKWKRLDRFLILGSAANTFYVSAKALTRDNALSVLECIKENGIRTVERIAEISESKRAPKNDSALFALAMASVEGDLETRRLVTKVFQDVVRTGTHLFHINEYRKQFGGWGRLWKAANQAWYQQPIEKLAYQVVKYRQRDGWTHRDILRLAHPYPTSEQYSLLYKWITHGFDDLDISTQGALLIKIRSAHLFGFELARKAKTVKEIVRLIDKAKLTWEMIPTEFLHHKEVWAALLSNLPMMAMVRNLGRMTSVELLEDMSKAVDLVCEKLENREYISKSGIHPLSILVALKTYQQGKGMRGKLEWSPVRAIVDSLDTAFYLAFGNVEPSNNKTMLALDVSGSMTWENIAGMPITPREASAAMALVTAKVEPHYMIVGFTSGERCSFGSLCRSSEISPLNISPRQRLDDVLKTLHNLPFGGTDCALPMLYALEKGLDIDTFVIFTDNETWANPEIHPIQALQEYRRRFNNDARLVVVGMTSTGFSIADSSDSGCLDVVGFDTATPQIISDFSQGKI